MNDTRIVNSLFKKQIFSYHSASQSNTTQKRKVNQLCSFFYIYIIVEYYNFLIIFSVLKCIFFYL